MTKNNSNLGVISHNNAAVIHIYGMTAAFSFTPTQLSIITGSLLGDGNLSKIRSKNGNSYFSKPQKSERRPYLEWHFDELSPFSSNLGDYKNKCQGKVYDRSQIATIAHPLFTDLRSIWYPSGKKIVPRNIELTPLAIAIWFFDDGSNHLDSRMCKFHTCAFERSDVNFLVDKLSEFGIDSYAARLNEIHVRADSYKTLIDLISPFMKWPCFAYKIRYRDSELNFTSDVEAAKMIEMYNQGYKQTEIAAQVGKSISVVSSILRGRRKKHLGVSESILPLSNTSGIKNVAWDKSRNKWHVSLKQKGKRITVGRFDRLEDAKTAIDLFREKQHTNG